MPKNRRLPHPNITPTCPAPVIIKEVKATERGVELRWTASQPGSKPLGVYIIERAEDGRHFAFVARVEKSFLSFLDAEGRAGDTYRIITEDTTGKNGRSEPSQPMVASASPGMTVMVSPDSTPMYWGLRTATRQTQQPTS